MLPFTICLGWSVTSRQPPDVSSSEVSGQTKCSISRTDKINPNAFYDGEEETMRDRSIFQVVLLASTMLASTSLSAIAGEVTTSRMLSADKEPQNWLMVNKDYAAHRYSELDQINKNNVKDLHVAYTVALGGVEGVGKAPLGGHQSTPLVDEGSMFVVDGFGSVYRIDVRDPAKARITWVMDPGTNKADFMVASNRGVTLYKNFVISVTGDCKVLWTKADTGELLKTVVFDDPKKTHC